MTKIHNWLQYYRACLIDGSRGEKDSIFPTPLKRNTSILHRILPDEMKEIWDEEKVSAYNFDGAGKNDNSDADDPEMESGGMANTNLQKEQFTSETEINKIEIAPVYLTTAVEHGDVIGGVKVHHPFWIPAYVDSNGRLYPPQEGETPIFIRNYINPNPKDLPTIAQMEVLDKKLTNSYFDTDTWNDYWSDCEDFFKGVTGRKFSDFQEETHAFRICTYQENNTTGNIVKLYNELISDKDAKAKKYAVLEKVLEQKVESENHRLTAVEIFLNAGHYGQMSGEFPLSYSQRIALAQFTSGFNKEVFAINGPPGTGKTTILQSVIANCLAERVLNQESVALIIGCSTNNQAITNILDSMQSEKTEDVFSQRWLPGVTSFGLYLAASSKNKEASGKYQMSTTSYLNDNFIKKLDDSAKVREYENHFKRQFTAYTGITLAESDEDESNFSIGEHLFKAIKNVKAKMDQALKVSMARHQVNAILQKNGFQDFDALKNKIKRVTAAASENRERQRLLNDVKIQLARRNRSFPFYIRIFPFKNFRLVKTNAFKLIVQPIIGELSATLKLYKFHSILSGIENLLFNTIDEEQKLQKLLSGLKALEKDISTRIINYQFFLEQWTKCYSKQWDTLLKKTGQEYKDLEVIQDTACKLDISYRYELFWWCVHFREWQYIRELGQCDPATNKERGRASYKAKLKRLAKVTPLFISTFHTLPKFTNYFNYSKGNKFYRELYDLMIVDEAGQVSPEVAVASLSFTKKIIAVGDVHQIEPVWNIVKGVDYANAQKYGVVSRERDFENIDDLGCTASNGSLMKMIRKSTPFSYTHSSGEEEKGAYLLEHRRCLNPIVAFSAKNVYKGSLKLMVGNKHNKSHSLPPLGYVHVNGLSEKHKGSSRKNIKEAHAIVQWVLLHKKELENAYGKALDKILAIITPFSAQKMILRRLLNTSLDTSVANNLVTGTVHNLQGAQRRVILFSAVHDAGDRTLFFDSQGKYNMLNVALTRAEHSFIVFGNMAVFNPHRNSPSGNLAKLLFSNEKYALNDRFLYESDLVYPPYKVERIDTLSKHRNTLRESLKTAKKELVIFSPFISINAIKADTVIERINNAIAKGVKVTILTDKYLDSALNGIKENSASGRKAIQATKADLRIVDGIHNKTICIDDSTIIEGSFNWLSATRDENSSYFRNETSVVIQGGNVKEEINKIKQQYNL